MSGLARTSRNIKPRAAECPKHPRRFRRVLCTDACGRGVCICHGWFCVLSVLEPESNWRWTYLSGFQVGCAGSDSDNREGPSTLKLGQALGTFRVLSLRLVDHHTPLLRSKVRSLVYWGNEQRASWAGIVGFMVASCERYRSHERPCQKPAST